MFRDFRLQISMVIVDETQLMTGHWDQNIPGQLFGRTTFVKMQQQQHDRDDMT
jgi:hypothetical protein